MKIRHKKNAHRLYLKLFLSNACLWPEREDTKELNKMTRTLAEVCYRDFGGNPLTNRQLKAYLRKVRAESPALLTAFRPSYGTAKLAKVLKIETPVPPTNVLSDYLSTLQDDSACQPSPRPAHPGAASDDSLDAGS